MTPDDIRHIVELAEAGKFREILGRYGERVIISGDAGEDYLEDPSAELTEICTISLMGEDESVEGFARGVLGVAGEKALDPGAAQGAVDPLVSGPPLKLCVARVSFDFADQVHDLADVDAIRHLFLLLGCITGCHFISPQQ